MGRQAALALIFAGGMGFLFATATPQTPEEVHKHLEKDGFSNVIVKGTLGRCGKGKSRFFFTARNAQSRALSGEVCAEPWPQLYQVSVNR
jgi:hypothetical protein